MTRIELLTEAIRKTLEIQKLSIDVLTDMAPRGFWEAVRVNLRSGYNWPENNSALSNMFNKNKSKILGLLNSSSQMYIPDNETIYSEQQASKLSTHNAIFTRDEMIRLIDEHLNIRLSDIRKTVQIELNKMEMPPEVQTIKGQGKGRKEDRQYEKIGPAIDKRLFELFMADCKKRKLSQGKMLDIILWHWYEKPKLSYEID